MGAGTKEAQRATALEDDNKVAARISDRKRNWREGKMQNWKREEQGLAQEPGVVYFQAKERRTKKF